MLCCDGVSKVVCLFVRSFVRSCVELNVLCCVVWCCVVLLQASPEKQQIASGMLDPVDIAKMSPFAVQAGCLLVGVCVLI